MRAVISAYVGVLLFAVFIFLGAGKLAYWQGLLYVVLALAGVTLNQLLTRKDDELIIERTRGARTGVAWDRRILGAYFLLNIVAFVIAGLDSGRFGWSGSVPLGITISGVVLMVLGQLLFAMAMRENKFFSSTVRLQSERGHRVCDTGLYRFVRHPGYLGMLLSQLSFPLVLGSYWAFIPVGGAVVLLVVRTLLEDRFLLQSLPGYVGYAARTKWRLVPMLF
ncbi:MAG TPA: isoprenylcysteine carboxylmethyltransferase family protein [Kouleothrix sp.]|nr:isoprenylcysteine carboxylmethyltransferase family protein [Kouleothrix sp.]